ncbi:MAG: transposase, partial [Acidobacteriota bacterium]|nr:transposase [Acidobacteriota bacterium]
MPRRPRIEFDGGLYHVFTRGNRREPTFIDDHDRRRFLERLEIVTTDTDIELYAYVLMPNHLHLVVRRRHVRIGRFMHRLLSPYARYFNARHEMVGHVFQGRYNALLCQDETYLLRLVRYVHRNPIRSKLTTDLDYPWSSYRAYLGAGPETWISVAPVLKMFGRDPTEALENFTLFHGSADADTDPDRTFTESERGVLGDSGFLEMACKRAAVSIDPLAEPRPHLDDVLVEVLAETGIGVEPIEVRGPSRQHPAC